MKKLALITILAAITGLIMAQQTTRTLTWDEIEREYLEYVPTSYSESNPAPVVFCLHGLGDNMTNFSGVWPNVIADQTGWIVITPQALDATVMGQSFGTAWNAGVGATGTMAGDIFLNPDVDDTGFLTVILDSLETYFNINPDSVFFTGFSLGGFMCNRMASELGNRITAVASVSGTMGVGFTPNPQVAINTMHIHGTADTQIAYEDAGFNTGMGVYSVGMGAEALVEYWRNFNNADESPVMNIFPDTQADGKTFERYVYLNGDNDTYTVFIKVVGGDHEWYYIPQNDMGYTTEIYKFFTNTMDFSVKTETVFAKSEILIYPNPAKNQISVSAGKDAELKIYNCLGSLLRVVNLENHNSLDISNLANGIYIFRIMDGEKSIDKKVVINR
ncbi:MAG: T9SS type A sorting domain-containing protein [Bacteroidales bacterium]|nr:T9SS type A sorting domain-containing protein [Bacteroidales bacterium]